MADVTLTLGVPEKTTLPASGLLRRVLVPAGTRNLKMRCPTEFLMEVVGDPVKADEAALDATNHFSYDGGTYSERMPGSGQGLNECLEADTYIYFSGAAGGENFWIHAVKEAP